MSPAVDVLSSLSAVAAAAILLFNLALQQRRSRVAGLLALMGVSLLLWGGAGFLPNSAALAATAMTSTVFFYFLFANRITRAENRLSSLLMLAAPLVLIVNLLLIWVGHGVSGDAQPAVTDAGTVVFLLLTIYAAAAFWAIMISRDDFAPRLRGAGLILIPACAAPLLLADWLLNGSLLLMSLATIWLVWEVVRAQTSLPLHDLREELRLANRDLLQSVSEVASLRTHDDQMSQQLQAAGQYRSDFLDKLGHKLRTPLNSITGYTELLKSGLYGDLNDKQLDRLGKIQRNSENLLDLLSNMLDLNAISAGRLELHRATLPINPLIEQVVSGVEPRLSEKGLALHVNLDADVPPAYGDESRICQVITQLIENAVKFTPKGEISIHSRSIHVENGVSEQFHVPLKGWLGDGEWVIVEVSDSGIGIAPEDQAKIFDEFYQVADPRTEDRFGTGLGLTIAKRLAELHEGALWVKSVPDQGSTFYLALHSAPTAKPVSKEVSKN